MTVRSMRLQRGLTQREVAEQMGVQRPAVCKMERKADMSISRFTEFVDALGGRWEISASGPRTATSTRMDTEPGQGWS